MYYTFLLYFFCGAEAFLDEEVVYSVLRVEKLADRGVVVQSVDNIGDVLRQINFDIPLALLELGGSVDEVGGEHLVDKAAIVCLVESLKSVAEQAEAGADEDSSRLELLELRCNFDH